MKVCGTVVAEIQLSSPHWSASMVQRPALWSVTEVPATVQTGVVSEVNTTGRVDEAVAEMVKGVSSRRRSDRASKVMD